MSGEILVSATRDISNPNSVTFGDRAEQIKAEIETEKKRQKLEKNSPYKRWTQFNLDETKRMMELALTQPKAHALLLFLVDQMDEHNAVVCSYQAMQELLGVSKATVARSLRTLKEGHFITILKSGSNNVYAINDTVYWKSWGNNKKYSKFSAKVVITESEQESNRQLSFSDMEESEESKAFRERYERIVSERYKSVVLKDE